MEIKLIDFEKHGDDRGMLVALEEGKNVPFEVKRVYYMFDTRKHVQRGFHAHRDLKQLAIAVRGSVKFHLDDGTEQVDVLLNDPAKGLFLDKMVWRVMSDFSEDCVLMVLADQLYEESDYIRNYEDFSQSVKTKKSTVQR